MEQKKRKIRGFVMYICVDFDGTIVDHQYPDIGDPAPGAIEYMRKWNETGKAKIILLTMRSGEVLDRAVAYLNSNGVELYAVNQNPSQIEWTLSRKVYGHVYVDDAGFGCPLVEIEGFRRCVDWSIVGPAILERLERKL